MQTHIKRVMSGSGTSRRVVLYTNNGAGEDGKPAVVYDSQTGQWSLQTDRPLTPDDFELVEAAIVAMKEHRAGVDAAIASEQH